jgi:hypothetical protein
MVVDALLRIDHPTQRRFLNLLRAARGELPLAFTKV